MYVYENAVPLFFIIDKNYYYYYYILYTANVSRLISNSKDN